MEVPRGVRDDTPGVKEAHPSLYGGYGVRDPIVSDKQCRRMAPLIHNFMIEESLCEGFQLPPLLQCMLRQVSVELHFCIRIR